MLKRRREIGMMYNEGLMQLAEIGKIQLPHQQTDQIYQEYIIKIPDMYKFKKFMDKKGIELLIRDTTPNHITYKRFFQKGLSLPVTEDLATSSVRLPTYPELTNQEVKTIIKAGIQNDDGNTLWGSEAHAHFDGFLVHLLQLMTDVSQSSPSEPNIVTLVHHVIASAEVLYMSK